MIHLVIIMENVPTNSTILCRIYSQIYNNPIPYVLILALQFLRDLAKTINLIREGKKYKVYYGKFKYYFIYAQSKMCRICIIFLIYIIFIFWSYDLDSIFGSLLISIKKFSYIELVKKSLLYIKEVR